MGELSRRVIAVDLDEVAADTVAKRLARYKVDYGEDLRLETLARRQIRDAVPPDRRHQVESILDEPGFSRDVPVMPGAREAIEELAARYDVVFATSAMDHPASLHDRYAWLREHFPFITDRHYVFCGSKIYLRADFLIDDNPRNLEVFSGTGILFDAHHNGAEQRFRRVSSWQEVIALFR